MNEDRASPPPEHNDGETPPAETVAAPSAGTPPTAPALLSRLVAEFAAMVRFYSRLPLPRLGPADDPATPPAFARAIRMLPVASAMIALPSAALVALLGPSGLPGLVVGALAIALLAFLTGAFHEDGLADVADGFGGGWTVERRLEIMKDSRIGAFAGVALAAQFVLRAALTGEAVDRFDGIDAALVLLAVTVFARVAPLALMVALAPARADGLGRAAGRPERGALALALAGGLLVLILLAGPIAGFHLAAFAVVLAGVALVGLAAMARDRIGGFTGDVVGAGTIVVEIAAMVGLLI